MKINEVEALVGITRKNIRFYEAEGLLSPRRNSQNGYRDYGETEVEVLRRIKLLRKLGLPLEEIRQMQHGAYTVGDGMRRHLVSLERDGRIWKRPSASAGRSQTAGSGWRSWTPSPCWIGWPRWNRRERPL